MNSWCGAGFCRGLGFGRRGHAPQKVVEKELKKRNQPRRNDMFRPADLRVIKDKRAGVESKIVVRSINADVKNDLVTVQAKEKTASLPAVL